MHGRRQSVRADLHGLLAAARSGTGGAILLEGVPGIGKSALLAEVRQAAVDTGTGVVAVTGSEAERNMALAGVTQLCVPLLGTLDAVPAHQARLVRVALGLVADPPAAAGGNETMALGLALLSVLIEAGRDHGVVVLIDDAQWLDPSSRQVFDFVARRLAGTPISLVAAQRTGDAGLRMTSSVSLDLLTTSESHDLLVGLAVERHVARAILDRTPGLPLLLCRIAEGLTEEQRTGLAALPDPLPAGTDLEAGYVAAIEQLTGDERAAVLLLAAVGDSDVTTVDSAAAAHLLPAVAAGLLLRSDDGNVGFVNPIARSAAYWSATPTARRAAHRIIAESIHPDSPGEIWHRSAAADGIDEHLAGRLLATGREAVRRGAAASSVVAFQRAAELTDDAGVRVQALVEGAAAAFAGGLHRVAELLVSRAESAGAEPDTLLEVQTNLATVTASPPQARRLLDRLAEARRSTQPEAADAARVASAMVSLRLFDVAAATASLARVDPQCTGRLARRAAVVATLIASRQSDPASVATLPDQFRHIHQTDRAPDDVRFLADAVTLALGSVRDGSLLALAGELHRDSGDVVPAIVPSLQLARTVQLSRSDLVGAAAAAQQAVDLAGELGLHAVRALALPWLASMQAGLCDAAAVATCRAVEAAGGDLAMVTARLSLGYYHLGCEAYEEAFATLMSLRDWSAGEVRTAMYWQADLAEAALRVGNRGVAEEQRDLLGQLAEVDGSPWLAGVHDRVSGQLCDDVDEAAPHFEAAIALLRKHDFMIAAARSSLMFGERLRRVRRRTASREPLLDARRTFDRAGMSAWVARCDRELAAAGSPVAATAQPAHAVLTPQELQVARWVVAGESNRAIAARLFLSPRTVEAHLSTIYRKLGTRARGELIALGRRDASLVAAG